jgi:hypothetical protein
MGAVQEISTNLLTTPHPMEDENQREAQVQKA